MPRLRAMVHLQRLLRLALRGTSRTMSHIGSPIYSIVARRNKPTQIGLAGNVRRKN